MMEVRWIASLVFYGSISLIATVTAMYGVMLTASHGVQLWLTVETSMAIAAAVITGYFCYLTWRDR